MKPNQSLRRRTPHGVLAAAFFAAVFASSPVAAQGQGSSFERQDRVALNPQPLPPKARFVSPRPGNPLAANAQPVATPAQPGHGAPGKGSLEQRGIIIVGGKSR